MAFKRSLGLRNKLLGTTVNIVTNGDFEDNVDGWSSTNITIAKSSSGEGFTGNYAAQFTTASATGCTVYKDIETKVGRRYTFSCALRNVDATNIFVKLGTNLDDDFYYTSPNHTDTTYTVYTYSFVATTDTTRITFVVTTPDANAYTAYVDTVKILDEANSIKDIFKYGYITIYGNSSQPAEASDAVPAGATKLVTITNNGGSTGITFGDASNGVISKTPSEVWSGQAVASGTATWFRLSSYGDNTLQDFTAERIDGSIATTGAELNMSNTSIVNQAVQTITIFDISIAS